MPSTIDYKYKVKLDMGYNPTSTYTIDIGGTKPMFIDPKTLKPCKHRWELEITEGADSWTLTPKCPRCGITGSPGDKGVNLRKLIKRLG